MAPIGAILYEWCHGVTSWVTPWQSLTPRYNDYHGLVWFYWGLTPQQQPGSYQGGEMMMKSVFWWRKPEYPEETTDRLSWSDCHGVTKFNWLGNQHDKFTYYHSCHVHLLRGPLRVTSIGSCLNAMPSGSTGGTSRSWQVINIPFAERAQTWQLLFPWASQLLFFTGKDLVTKWQNKGKVAVTHAILYVPAVSPGQTVLSWSDMNLWDNATLSFPPRSIFKRHSFSKYMCCSIHI